MLRITNRISMGSMVILAGVLDVTMYSRVARNGIDIVDIIGIALAVVGGLAFIWNYRLGWIFSTIFALKFVLTSLYNLTTDYPIRGLLLTGFMILVIVYLNNTTTRFTLAINFRTQLITLATGTLLGLANILI